MSKEDNIETLIDRLRGTTGSIEMECQSLGLSDLDDDVTAAVDAEIFCCTCCGWWCGIEEEMSEDFALDELTCEQCCLEGISE